MAKGKRQSKRRTKTPQGDKQNVANKTWLKTRRRVRRKLLER